MIRASQTYDLQQGSNFCAMLDDDQWTSGDQNNRNEAFEGLARKSLCAGGQFTRICKLGVMCSHVFENHNLLAHVHVSTRAPPSSTTSIILPAACSPLHAYNCLVRHRLIGSHHKVDRYREVPRVTSAGSVEQHDRLIRPG